MREAPICLWRDISVGDLERLEHAQSSGELCRVLSDWLTAGSPPGDLRSSALLDLYYHALRFCWDSGFTREQTSCVFSIVKETHAACVGSPLGNVAECHGLLQLLLLRHAVLRPPFSSEFFSPQQLLLISHYMVETYFRHFKLYKYVFTPQVNLDLSILYDGISETDETRTTEEAVDKEIEDYKEPDPDGITCGPGWEFCSGGSSYLNGRCYYSPYGRF
ncbi:cilia- and flagella-associated protein 119 [Hyla sarda]|uniref:cilia- and flagella-associated protein 119 n=1 Tax=Hyla sarda TaxID=327740 RepID=UPI0024C3FD13|nr:cilia- and flagella-associated protein 119 [Hyla sarda]